MLSIIADVLMTAARQDGYTTPRDDYEKRARTRHEAGRQWRPQTRSGWSPPPQMW